MKTYMHTPSGVGRRDFLRAAATGLAAGSLVGVQGCRGFSPGGSDSKSKNTLTIAGWGEGKRARREVAVAKLFEKKNPDAQINTQITSYNGYWDKLGTRLAGGNPPDVFKLYNLTLSEYASRGACRKLDDLWSDPLGLADLPKTLLQQCTYNGHYYFIPLGVSTRPAVLYNRTLLKEMKLEEPDFHWSLQDFRRLGGEVRQASSGKTYGTADLGGMPGALEAYLRSVGKNLFTEQGQPGFKVADLAEWYDLWVQLRESKISVPMELTAGVTGFENNPIVTGKAAMAGAASAKGAEGYQNIMEDQIGFTVFPRQNGAQTNGTIVSAMGYWSLSSQLDEEKAKLAARYSHFRVTDPEAMSMVKLKQGLPDYPKLRKRMLDNASRIYRRVHENVKYVRSQDPAPVPMAPPGAGELLNTVLSELNQQVGFRKTTPSKAAARFFEESEKTLG